MPASASGGWCTTRSGPSATISSSSSVTSVAISTMTWRAGSSPVISRSIQTSTGAGYRSPCDSHLPWRMPTVSSCPWSASTPTCRCPPTPAPATPALDLVAREGATLAAGGGRALVPTGIAIAIPEGYAGFVQPRSGLALRHGVTCLNTPGLIDAGYRDELQGAAREHRPVEAFEVQRGERIAQLVVQAVARVEWAPVDELEGDNRGGGFGSTGR